MKNHFLLKQESSSLRRGEKIERKIRYSNEKLTLVILFYYSCRKEYQSMVSMRLTFHIPNKIQILIVKTFAFRIYIFLNTVKTCVKRPPMGHKNSGRS